MPRIQVTIRPDGAVTLEGQEFLGATCTEATAALEKALGLVRARETKPEFYTQDMTHEQEMVQ